MLFRRGRTGERWNKEWQDAERQDEGSSQSAREVLRSLGWGMGIVIACKVGVVTKIDVNLVYALGSGPLAGPNVVAAPGRVDIGL